MTCTGPACRKARSCEFSTMESYILQDAVGSGFTDSALLALCTYKGDPEAMMRYYSTVMKKMIVSGKRNIIKEAWNEFFRR